MRNLMLQVYHGEVRRVRMSAHRMHAVIFIYLAAISACATLPQENNTLLPHDGNLTLPLCELKVEERSVEASMFTHPSHGSIINNYEVYYVKSSGSIEGGFCELPVEALPSATSESPQEYYRHFICYGSSPWFTNANSTRSNHLLFLHLSNCKVSMMNVATYGKTGDMKSLILNNCSIVEETKNAAHAYNLIDDLVPPIEGFDKMVALTLSSQKTENMTIPRVLFTHEWPEMSEMELRGIHDTSQYQINSLKRSMPILQSLEVHDSAISCFPSDFPWAAMTKSLPQNLSRTILMNDHYAVSFGLIIGPHRFRRRLILADALSDLSLVKFKGQLDMISLANNQLHEIAEDIFNGVEGLQNLKLNNNNLTDLPLGIFSKLTLLKRLDLSHNQISRLPNQIFGGLSKLKVLKMTNNRLQTISPGLFASLSKLTLLDLSGNKISSFGNDAFYFEKSNAIREINLNDNMMVHFPQWIFTTRSLRDVKLSRNLLSFEILLRDLGQMSPDTITFQNRESASSLVCPFKPLYHKTVDLSYNKFTSLDVDNIADDKATAFRTILNFFDLDLKGNDILCDCHTYRMYKFLNKERNKPEDVDYSKLRVPSYYYKAWKCSNSVAAPNYYRSSENIPIVDVQSRAFMCQNDMDECPYPCICLERSCDGSIVVNCSARNMTSLPTTVPKHTDTVLLRHNSLKTITDAKYLSSLSHLDVSNSEVEEISDEAISSFDYISRVHLHDNSIERFPVQFKHLQKVKLTLRRNRFVCDCHEKWVVKWIFKYRMLISDIDEVKCSSGASHSEIIYHADVDKFICEITKETIIAIAIIIFVIMSLVIMVLVLGHKFRGEIKVLLYFHFKWHPFDRTDATDVVDKLYDAVVSYNQADVDYVLNILQPAVETPESPYRLCIHERDFKPGGGITQNVLYSVKYSRRMIMVLTKNYLKSEWCRLEFKSAHRRVLKDRSNYLIVILFDGLIVDDLDEEMKFYLKTNTYIMNDCKLFMQRLHYALPRKPLSLLREEAFPEGGFDTLFPSPASVAMMQIVENMKTLARDPSAKVTPVVWDRAAMGEDDCIPLQTMESAEEWVDSR